ncbi:MAG: hypothetical protein WCO21_02085 [bacterium]
MSNQKQIETQDNISSLIKSGKIKMKPRWYFLLGSIAMFSGLFGIATLSIFLTSLITFSLRTHGPMGEIRYEQLLSSFPWWAIPVVILGIGVGIWILREYDFSYKHNFLYIVIGAVAAILFIGWSINYFGFDSGWMGRGGMRGLYKQYDGGMMRSGGRGMQRAMYDGSQIYSR